MRRGGAFALQDEAASAVRAVDAALAFHIQKDPGMAERAVAAVTGNDLLIDV